MVREMKSPEKRNLVTCPMPPPERVIEKDNRHERVEWWRDLHLIEQTDAVPHRPLNNRGEYRRLEHGENRQRESANGEIPNDVPQLGLEHFSKRRDRLPRGEEHESTAYDGGGDRVLCRHVVHRSPAIQRWA